MPTRARYRLDDVAHRLAPAVAVAALLALPLSAGMRADAARQGQTPPCVIRGSATTGQARLPGVGLTVTPIAGGAAISTSTGQDGSYSVVIPGPGTYTVATDFTGFAPVTLDVVVEPSCRAQQDITLTLASRVEAPKPAAPATAAAAPAAQAPAAPARAADRRQAPAPFRGTVGPPSGAPGQPGAGSGQGQQTGQPAGVSVADDPLDAVAAQLSLPPGFSVGTSGDSLTTSGAAGQVNPMLFMMMGGEGPGGRGPDGMSGGMGGFGPDGQPGGIPGMGGEQGGFVAGGFPQGGGFGGGPGGGPGGGSGGGPGGGPGGGGMGGRGGGPGGGGMPGIAGRLGMAGGRGGANRIRVQASYNLSGIALRRRAVPAHVERGCSAHVSQSAADAEHRRAVQDSRHLQREDGRVVLPQLQRRLRRKPVRGVFDRADGRVARRRLLGLERHADRSADRAAVPEQPDPGVADRRGGAGAHAVLPAAQPAERREELLPLVDHRQPLGRHQRPVHEVVRGRRRAGEAPRAARAEAAAAAAGWAAVAGPTSPSACSTAGPMPIATARFRRRSGRPRADRGTCR